MLSKPSLLNLLLEGGVVPIILDARLDNLPALCEMTRAILNAGAHAVEIANRHPESLEAFKLLQQHLQDSEYGSRLGVGTMWDAKAAEEYIEAGAWFVVAPGFDQGVAEVCKARNVPYVPGFKDPTQAQKALDAGAAALKFFTATTPLDFAEMRGSLDYRYADVPSMVSGYAVHSGNHAAWFAAGASAIIQAYKVDEMSPEAAAQITSDLLKQVATHKRR